MTQIVSEIVKKGHVPVGVEVLLNDPQASLVIAKITGAKFIRTDYFVDKCMEKNTGEMEINPQKLLAYKKKIKADSVKILADVQVKYAKLLEKGKTIISPQSRQLKPEPMELLSVKFPVKHLSLKIYKKPNEDRKIPGLCWAPVLVSIMLKNYWNFATAP